MNLRHLLDLDMFSPFQVAMLLAGTFLWLWYYVILLRNSYKLKYVEMPIFAACANIAWEMLWGFYFKTAMGNVLSFGYKAAFILDIFIFTAVFLHMRSYQQIPLIRKYFAPLCLFAFAMWTLFLYFFQIGGYDTPTASTSAYMLNIFVSFLYWYLLLRDGLEKKSYAIAWLKLTGNLAFSIFVVNYFPHLYMVHLLCALCFVFDLWYLVLFIKMRKEAQALAPA
ncbi:MAG: hypothetical protein IPL49_13550 [Saprospirales bacterium]|nr:hypothetical protein [Saprospirales bacterium]